MSETQRYLICPYCGTTQSASPRCVFCGGFFEPLSRLATQIAMGPWFIRDKENPYRPGCSYEVLRKQCESGKVKLTTVLRGPTTHQFWTVARHVQGVAHLLGVCHSCGARVEAISARCPKCSESFRAPPQRDEMGLQYETNMDAAAAQRELNKQMSDQSARTTLSAAAKGREGESASAAAAAGPRVPGMDLLDEVIGSASAPGRSGTLARKLERDRERERALEHAPARAQLHEEPGHSEPEFVIEGAGAGHALDFGPLTEDASTVALEALEARSRRLSVMTWLLVLLNLVGFALLVGLFWWYSKKGAPTQAAGGPTATQQAGAYAQRGAPMLNAANGNPPLASVNVSIPDALDEGPAVPSLFDDQDIALPAHSAAQVDEPEAVEPLPTDEIEAEPDAPPPPRPAPAVRQPAAESKEQLTVRIEAVFKHCRALSKSNKNLEAAAELRKLLATVKYADTADEIRKAITFYEKRAEELKQQNFYGLPMER